MKKIISIILIIITIFTLCSCGNMNLGPGKYTFTHVHASDHLESYCIDINRWNDATSGIEVRNADTGNTQFLSEGTYIMYESPNDCPFCK